jgi:hypothetical protein
MAGDTYEEVMGLLSSGTQGRRNWSISDEARKKKQKLMEAQTAPKNTAMGPTASTETKRPEGVAHESKVYIDKRKQWQRAIRE